MMENEGVNDDVSNQWMMMLMMMKMSIKVNHDADDGK